MTPISAALIFFPFQTEEFCESNKPLLVHPLCAGEYVEPVVDSQNCAEVFKTYETYEISVLARYLNYESPTERLYLNMLYT